MAKLSARLLVILAGLIASACSGNSDTGPSSDEKAASGTYQLSQVRGSSLPVPLFGQCNLGSPQPCSACSASATAGTLTLEAGANSSDRNNFSLSLVASGPCVDPQGRSPTSTSSNQTGTMGTWTTSGSTITFSIGSNSMGITTATLSGSTVLMSFNWLNADPGGQPAAVNTVFSK